jgi:hypothetical protein
MGGVVALSWRGGTIHGLPFVVLVLLQLERDGSLIVVTVVVFVEVALVGKMVWIVLTPLWSKWLLTVNSCIKVRLDLQADKSPVVVKGPFFPRVVNPRYRILGTNV